MVEVEHVRLKTEIDMETDRDLDREKDMTTERDRQKRKEAIKGITYERLRRVCGAL